MRKTLFCIGWVLLAVSASAECRYDRDKDGSYGLHHCPVDVTAFDTGDHCQASLESAQDGGQLQKYMMAEFDSEHCQTWICTYDGLQSKYRDNASVSHALKKSFDEQESLNGHYWESHPCQSSDKISGVAVDSKTCHYDKADTKNHFMPGCPSEIETHIAKESACMELLGDDKWDTSDCAKIACPRQEVFNRHETDRAAASAFVKALDDITKGDDSLPWWTQECKTEKRKP